MAQPPTRIDVCVLLVFFTNVHGLLTQDDGRDLDAALRLDQGLGVGHWTREKFEAWECV